ncbi:MAG TPA: hypothetical protein VFK54_03980 [Candidatus Limnocylindrales bacterium]|nr:hypothetical protein [Candidatus Limnocylindrales bacterium]
MSSIASRLEDWRRAVRRRDATPRGSQAWLDADEDVRHAQAAYHWEAARAATYYAELEFAALDRSFARWRAPRERMVLGR